LEATGLEKPAGHILDGVSLMRLLQQTGNIQRDAYFTWFPHLIPAVSVRQGDWKLIRRFEPHPLYPETEELYNLKDDIGETHNLAAKMPDKARQLQALIDGFIKDTNALAPKPNPAYNPNVTQAAAALDATAGLVPRMCKLTQFAGALRIESDGRTPFLGTGQVKQAGPVTLKLRIRAEKAGTGKVQWKTAEQEAFPETGQTTGYELKAGQDWQEIIVSLPIQGKAGIVRLYLPVASTVEIETMEFTSTKTGQVTRKWDFSKSQSPAENPPVNPEGR
jgi:hypothetical protein